MGCRIEWRQHFCFDFGHQALLCALACGHVIHFPAGDKELAEAIMTSRAG
jgi:hypothetical protein